jgi:hypothetical protein
MIDCPHNGGTDTQVVRPSLGVHEIQEQAMCWLTQHGPLVTTPGLAKYVTRSHVDDQVIQIRHNVFLVPDAHGRLPSWPRAINLVDPDGYISGRGALSLYGCAPEDPPSWYSVSPRHNVAPIAYGLFSAHFVHSPSRPGIASTQTIRIEEDAVTVATPARALIDEIEIFATRFDYAATLLSLRDALQSGQTTESVLVDEIAKTPRRAAARRLGFLLDLATGQVNPEILELAQSVSGMTGWRDSQATDWKWRLYLPEPRQTILDRVSSSLGSRSSSDVQRIGPSHQVETPIRRHGRKFSR